MNLGFIGTGKMGFNMVLRLKSKGQHVVAHNRSPEPLYDLHNRGVSVAFTIDELMSSVKTPRVIWMMISPDAVDKVIELMLNQLELGDIIIDGGNSFYKDSMRRYQELKNLGVGFLDAGVGGGPDEALTGLPVMIGGEKETFLKVEKLFKDLSVDDYYAYLGISGAGHYAKMAGNGIEWGMIQSLAEGFELLKDAPFKYDLKEISRVYLGGSAIESKLLERLYNFYEEYGTELDVSSENSGRLNTTVKVAEMAKDLGIKAKFLKHPGNQAFKKNKQVSYKGKIIKCLSE